MWGPNNKGLFCASTALPHTSEKPQGWQSLLEVLPAKPLTFCLHGANIALLTHFWFMVLYSSPQCRLCSVRLGAMLCRWHPIVCVRLSSGMFYGLPVGPFLGVFSFYSHWFGSLHFSIYSFYLLVLGFNTFLVFHEERTVGYFHLPLTVVRQGPIPRFMPSHCTAGSIPQCQPFTDYQFCMTGCFADPMWSHVVDIQSKNGKMLLSFLCNFNRKNISIS